MHFIERIRERFAEHKKLEERRELIVWYLPWLESLVNKAIGEVWRHEATTSFDPGGSTPIRSIEQRYQVAGFCFGKRVWVTGTYEGGGFKITVSGDRDSNLENRLQSFARVQEVYDLLETITEYLCANVPTLDSRLGRPLFPWHQIAATVSDD